MPTPPPPPPPPPPEQPRDVHRDQGRDHAGENSTARAAERSDPPKPTPTAGDRLDESLSRLLSVCVRAAAVVIAVGLVACLWRFHESRAEFSRFVEPDDSGNSLVATIAAAGRLDARAILTVGVLLLLATPIARVTLTFVTFAARRDRVYVSVTLVVLAVLLFSLTRGG